MKLSLEDVSLLALSEPLRRANQAFVARYPGESGRRQPVHTVYGGAHLFHADAAPKLGALALRSLEHYAPDWRTFARAIGLGEPEERSSGALPSGTGEGTAELRVMLDLDGGADGGADGNGDGRAGGGAGGDVGGRDPSWLARIVYDRVVEKLRREPVEDYRIDFEDGYGNRPDAEEDGHAVSAAGEVARGLAEGTLPPFIGIRVKPLTEELHERSVRTLDLFLTALVAETGGQLPPGFVLTLPKITIPEQVAFFAAVLGTLEERLGLAPGALAFEMMVETPQVILNARGESALPLLLDAAGGRATAAHFGTYDYTAGCGITAAHQGMGHGACDFARHAMQVALAGTGVWLSDGATNVMPVAPQRASGRPLSPAEERENADAVHRAWRLHYDDVRHSLAHAFYQGWDLHPAQLPTRYAAVYAFFLEGLGAAAERLRAFVARAAQATLVGDVFDDAATGQGLLNYFLRGVNCGALTESETLARTGLTLDELRGRSFVAILGARREQGAVGREP